LTKSRGIGKGNRGPATNPTSIVNTDAVALAVAPTAEDVALEIETEIRRSRIARPDLAKVLDGYRDDVLKQLRADLTASKAIVATMTAETACLTILTTDQGKTIDRLTSANAVLQAWKDGAHTEAEKAAGQKAQDDKLAEIARIAEKKAAEKAAEVAAFIVRREEKKAEYERRIHTSYQDSAEDPNSAEDGASRQARIARENNEQMLTNNACFDDYKTNWKDRTEPPPEWREEWADLHPSSMTPQQIAKRQWVANDPKSTDAEKKRVGILNILKPLPPPRRPGL
jgi:hypothetical protein